jgi:hypothetical protein
MKKEAKKNQNKKKLQITSKTNIYKILGLQSELEYINLPLSKI